MLKDLKAEKDATITLTITLEQKPFQLLFRITKGNSILETVRQYCLVYAIPKQFEHRIYSLVQSLLFDIKNKNGLQLPIPPNSNGNNEAQIKSQDDKHDLFPNVKRLASKYKTYTTAYDDNDDNEPLFHEAYQKLIQLPIPGLFDFILKLEQKYAKTVENMTIEKEATLAETQARQEKELQRDRGGHRGAGLTSLLARLVEEQEMAQAVWESDLDELHKCQRREYRDFIELLLEECQVEAKKKDVSKIYLVTLLQSVVDTIELKSYQLSNDMKELRKELALSLEMELQQNHPSIESEGEKLKSEEINPILQGIIDMGFSMESAQTALEMANNNMETAVNLLLEKPKEVEKFHTSHSAKSLSGHKDSTKHRPNIPIPSSTSDSQMGGRSSPTLNTSKSWLSMGFLQQQKQNINNAITTSKSQSSMLRWIGKAIERVGSDEPINKETLTPTVPLIESFTVTLGNQVKSTHNLRLLGMNLEELYLPSADPIEEVAHKAHIMTSLYSQDISGLVVLLTKKDWPNYFSGKSANPELFKACRRTTELHFQDIEHQIKQVEEMLPRIDNESRIEEGDPVGANGQRPAYIVGIRNILRTAFRYNVMNITIPLLPPPPPTPPRTMSFHHHHPISAGVSIPLSSSPTLSMSSKMRSNSVTALPSQASLHRRVELILTNVKSFIVEYSRSTRKVASGEAVVTTTSVSSGSSTIQLVIPRHTEESVFEGYRSLVAAVFKTN